MSVEREVDYTRHYRWWHDETDPHYEGEVASAGIWLSRYWPYDRSTPILDIGCGMGFVVGSFLRAGFSSVEGVDADRGQVAQAQARNLPVSLVTVANTTNWMSERRNRYGFVTAIDVLEHIPRNHILDFLDGVRGLLRPNGVFLCRVPNANSSMASVYRYLDWTHHTSFTQHSLDFVLYNAGFGDIRIEPTPALPLSRRLKSPGQWLLGFFRAFRRLEMIAEFGWSHGSKTPLTLNILATAVKDAAPTKLAGNPPRVGDVVTSGIIK